MKKIQVDIAFDKQSNVFGLVSVVEVGVGTVVYMQTVGSAIVGSDELTTLILAAQRTLNAFTPRAQVAMPDGG